MQIKIITAEEAKNLAAFCENYTEVVAKINDRIREVARQGGYHLDYTISYGAMKYRKLFDEFFENQGFVTTWPVRVEKEYIDCMKKKLREGTIRHPLIFVKIHISWEKNSYDRRDYGLEYYGEE